jgi:acetyl-CoA synthetase
MEINKNKDTNAVTYEQLYREFKLEIPEYYNFGFDVIDNWAKDRTKLALVSLDRSAEKAT